MLEEQNWRIRGKCRKLTPKRADELFFPGSGGKPKAAERFCKGCPVMSQCLIDAIEYNLDGFIAGTTKDERTVMANLRRILIKELDLPPEPVLRRKVYRKIITYDQYAYLDEVEPTVEELVVVELVTEITA